MTDFDLDLRAVEEQIDDEEEHPIEVSLGVLDGATPDADWIESVEDDTVLLLSIDGDLEYLASGFASEVREMGGELLQFRGFLVVTPPGVGLDTDRLE